MWATDIIRKNDLRQFNLRLAGNVPTNRDSTAQAEKERF
jgi:hypothetical protein